jgi:hypothetical protein
MLFFRTYAKRQDKKQPANASHTPGLAGTTANIPIDRSLALDHLVTRRRNSFMNMIRQLHDQCMSALVITYSNPNGNQNPGAIRHDDPGHEQY